MAWVISNTTFKSCVIHSLVVPESVKKEPNTGGVILLVGEKEIGGKKRQFFIKFCAWFATFFVLEVMQNFGNITPPPLMHM